MHPLQAFVNQMGQKMKEERANNQMTLGSLMEALFESNKDYVVKFEDGSFPGEFNSYRGYYCDLSVSKSQEKITVGQLRDLICEKVLNKTFEGYKGGDYLMTRGTPLHCAGYGYCGEAIIDYKLTESELILITKDID